MWSEILIFHLIIFSNFWTVFWSTDISSTAESTVYFAAYDPWVRIFKNWCLMNSKKSLSKFLQKNKEVLYNLGAISSYTSMLIFLWHGIAMFFTKSQPQKTLLLYAASTLFSILVMAPYKWDRKWMRIKTSVGIIVFGSSLVIYSICLLLYWSFSRRAI